MKSIIDQPTGSPFNCQVTQSFTNDPQFRGSIETYGEVQQPLYYAGWRFSGGNKAFIPPGITIIADSRTSVGGICAARFKDLLISLNVSPVSLRIDDDLASRDGCEHKNCLEVLVGKLDTP